jgi:glycosyltransferase involved in cell wall biosynthesis
VFDPRIFHKQAKTLVTAGYDVALVAQHDKEEIVDGVRIVPLPTPKNRLERMAKTVWKVLRLAWKEKADVYHFHDPELIPVGLILKVFGKKVIYDVHEDVPEQILSKEYMPKFLRRLICKPFRVFENRSSKFFDFVITATDGIRDKFLKYTPNVVDVKNYVSLEYAKNHVTRHDNRNVLRLIFVGGIYGERGITEGIKAINLLPDLPLEFLLYGFADSKFLLELRKLDRLGRLEYQGTIPYTEVMNKLRHADIGFICDCPLKRHKESLPVKLFEYMAAGLPSIASEFPLWKQIVEKHNCGLCVDPQKPEQIANAIRYLYENRDVRRCMGQNARKAILEEYNWEVEGKTLLAVYESIVAGGRKG